MRAVSGARLWERGRKICSYFFVFMLFLSLFMFIFFGGAPPSGEVFSADMAYIGPPGGPGLIFTRFGDDLGVHLGALFGSFSYIFSGRFRNPFPEVFFCVFSSILDICWDLVLLETFWALFGDPWIS